MLGDFEVANVKGIMESPFWSIFGREFEESWLPLRGTTSEKACWKRLMKSPSGFRVLFL
jgi:hypothetical protein